MKAIEHKVSKKGVHFALVKESRGFAVYELCRNYSGHVRGGISFSWRYIKNGLDEDAARALFARRSA